MRCSVGILAMPCRDVPGRSVRRIGYATRRVLTLGLGGPPIVIAVMTIVESLHEGLSVIKGDTFNWNRLHQSGFLDLHDLLPFFLTYFISVDFYFFHAATTEIYTLSLHAALPIFAQTQKSRA